MYVTSHTNSKSLTEDHYLNLNTAKGKWTRPVALALGCTTILQGFCRHRFRFFDFRLLTSIYTLPKISVAEIEFQFTAALFPPDKTKAFLLIQPQISSGLPDEGGGSANHQSSHHYLVGRLVLSIFLLRVKLVLRKWVCLSLLTYSEFRQSRWWQ